MCNLGAKLRFFHHIYKLILSNFEVSPSKTIYYHWFQASLFPKRLKHLGDALFLLLHVWVNIEIKGCCDVGMTEQYTYSLVVKDGILKEHSVRRHVRKNGSISYDVYSLELVIAVAFRIDSIEISKSIRQQRFIAINTYRIRAISIKNRA